MGDWIQLVGPNHAVQLFGVKLVGVNAHNGLKLVFSIVLVALAIVLDRLARAVIRKRVTRVHARAGFWARQGVSVVISVVTAIGLLSIWFDDPANLATAAGLVTAGLAFAAQRVVTALGGYVLILRGSTFNVGDRIMMGGVRGDVVALGFMQTTIMEMGQPPAVQSAEPAMWVRSRQPTGRIVTVSNAKVFDEPVYNFTREFSFIWEELSLPIAFRDDHAAVERILLDAARDHTVAVAEIAEPEMQRLERLYDLPRAAMGPRVYWRMTDNWLELTVRFLVRDHGIREVKDAMSRDILPALNAAGIGIASTTFEIVGLPDVRIRRG